MHCPFCRHPDSRVVDSRTTDDGTSIHRRRQCPDCSRRFTTVETCSLMVVKRSGVTEPFSRTKVINGVRKACQGRPVTEDALAQLGQRVEEAVRATGSAELTTHDVGLAIEGRGAAPCLLLEGHPGRHSFGIVRSGSTSLSTNRSYRGPGSRPRPALPKPAAAMASRSCADRCAPDIFQLAADRVSELNPHELGSLVDEGAGVHRGAPEPGLV